MIHKKSTKSRRVVKRRSDGVRQSYWTKTKSGNSTKRTELNNFLDGALEELSRYNRTKNTTYLREAGNKLYCSYLLLIELAYNIEISNTREANPYANSMEDTYPIFKEIRFNTLSLHKWFYEGVDDELYAHDLTKRTIKLFRNILRKV